MNKFNFFREIKNLFSRREKWLFLGVVVLAVLAAFFQTLGVASILPFISLVMDRGLLADNRFLLFLFNFFGFEKAYTFTIFFGFLTLAVIIVGNVVFAISTWAKIRFIWAKSHNLSTTLLRKYLSRPYIYFLGKNSNDLAKNVLSEVEQLTNQLFMPILSLITSGTMALVILILLLLVNPVVAISAIILFTVFYTIIFLYLRQSLRDRGEKRMKENTGRFITINEALVGIKDIKVLGRESHFYNRFKGHSDKFSRMQAWSVVVVNIPRYLIEIVAFGGVVAIILWLISTGQSSSQIIPLIAFFVFAGYRLIPSLQDVFKSFTNFQFNKILLNKVYADIVDFEDDLKNVEELIPLSFTDNIAFSDVSFRYPDRAEAALEGINFEVKKGSSIGIVGPTGGGKTTILDSLLGLLDPLSGQITIDGKIINKENISNWQKNLGYVPQQIYLADSTVAHNIAFGVDTPDLVRVQKVAQIANISKFIENDLPDQYDTIIGERGIRLSGGQRQRLGIARALYHNPDILVFDEATSALDIGTEGAVLKAIDNISKFKTIIIVAHRLKTVEHCDTIYFLDKGRIVDSGTYQELLAGNSQFKAMARS